MTVTVDVTSPTRVEVDTTEGVTIAGLQAERDAREAADALLIPLAQKGAASGVASLDGAGTIPDGQIPATVARDAEVSTAVSAAVAALVASAPGTLDTLNELAAALANDPNFATTITTLLAGKQPLDSDLTAIAALSTTAFGRALLALADAAALRTAAGLGTAATANVGDFDPAGAATAAAAALVNSSPTTLDTLKELADALGDDPNFAATTATLLGTKVDTAGTGLAKSGTTLRRAAAGTGFATLAALPSASANPGRLERTADAGIYESDGSSWQVVRDPAGTYESGFSVNAKTKHGAKGNAVFVTDGAINISTNPNLLISAAAGFSSASVGNALKVGGATADGKTLETTIATYVAADRVLMTAAAGTTVSAANVVFGADDTAAIQATVDEASVFALAVGGNVEVKIPAGSYLQTAKLVPKDRVTITGAGSGRTRTYAPSLDAGWGDVRSEASPLSHFKMTDLAIDGTFQSGAYTPGKKGFYVEYNYRCTYRDLLVENTYATGFACDYPNDVTVDNVRVNNSGRGNPGTAAGGNGIGIGLGGWSTGYEPLVVSNCSAVGVKRFGFFIERQSALVSRGARFVGNYAYGCEAGFVDAGATGAVFEGNQAYANGTGFAVNAGTFLDANPAVSGPAPGNLGKMVGNHAERNTIVGIDINAAAAPQITPGGYMIADNTCEWNGQNGIRVRFATDLTGITIRGNGCHRNGQEGILLQATSTGILKHPTVSENNCSDNGRTSGTLNAAVAVDTDVTGGRICGNHGWSTAATQLVGFKLHAARTITNVDIDGNDWRDHNAVVSILGTIVGSIGRNPGWTDTNLNGPTLDTFDVMAVAKAFASSNFTTYAQGSTSYFGGRRASTGAQNASVTFKFAQALTAGTWTLALLHTVNTDNGIYTIAVSPDNVTYTDLGTIDSYAASAAATRTELVGVTIAAGMQFVRFKMATKNATSTNYTALLNALFGVRTGA